MTDILFPKGLNNKFLLGLKVIFPDLYALPKRLLNLNDRIIFNKILLIIIYFNKL